ncbi:zinc finger protein 665-like isoform X2 [Syngnathoides biaculeatus]|uniref:zinc finger protein 665-like isoform X2 n=1 Tax=Syngnathoides biaculeatus TaxID=300417 RepID=UPI002ADDB318|nr:zinc finger protein 665-like isoform X2 [Syngnathoides biaculeatus]
MVLRCAWGMCNGDERYPERLLGGHLVRFPTPKRNLEKCMRWIKACGRPHEQLNVSKINKHKAICSKHFVGGHGPTELFPDPVPADASKPRPPRLLPRKRSCPDRADVSSEKKAKTFLQTEKITIANVLPTAVHEVPSQATRAEEPSNVCMERPRDFEADAAETFRSQAALILELAVEAAVGILHRSLAGEQGRAACGVDVKPKLTATLNVAAKEAVRQICSVFGQLLASLVKENETLRDKVGQLEAEKTKNAKRPAAIPASLAASIINTAKASSAAASGDEWDTARVPRIIIGPRLHAALRVPSGPAATPPDNDLRRDAESEASCATSLPAPAEEPPEPEVLPAATEETSEPATDVERTAQTVEVKTKEKMAAPAQLAESAEDPKEQENKRRRELYKNKRFFCELCNKGYHQQHQLRKHMSRHAKPFPCTLCDKGFYKATTLHKHQQAHRLREAQDRDPDKMLPCEQCGRKFRLGRQLRAHQAMHRLEKTPLPCATCGRTFTSAAVLRYHQVSHAEVKPFMCDVCGKGFQRKRSLREHQTVHTGARPYPCQTCGKRFSTSGNLRVHKRSHSDERPFKCGECDKTFKCRMGLLQHRVVHSGEKPFVCQTCGLSFGLKYNFQRHLRLHSGEKPFKCEKCGEGFSGTWALKTHMLVHGAEKPFMCDLCGKTFFYNCQLQKHQLLVHLNKERAKAGAASAGSKRRRRLSSGTKGFICKSCGKGFSSVSTLRTHEKSHAEHKEFVCETCGKSFHLRHLYIYHTRQHSGDRPYVCAVCQKAFLLQSQLRQHELLHTGVKPHQCQQCGKAFRTPQNYHRHLLVHTGEKPYECDACGRRFRQSNQLKSHMQIHTGVKLYPCQACGRGFSDSRQLKKHRCGDAVNGSLESDGKGKNEKSSVFAWTDGFVNE